MGTLARDAVAANETVAADARLDTWMAARDLGRESTRAELEELVRDLAARPELWRQSACTWTSTWSGPDGTLSRRTGDYREEIC